MVTVMSSFTGAGRTRPAIGPRKEVSGAGRHKRVSAFQLAALLNTSRPLASWAQRALRL